LSQFPRRRRLQLFHEPAPPFFPQPPTPMVAMAYPFKPPRVIVRLHVTNSGNSDVAFVCCLHKSISLQRQKVICIRVGVCVLPLCLTFHSICHCHTPYMYVLRPPQLPGVLYAFHFTLLPVDKHFIPFFPIFHVFPHFFLRPSHAQYFSRVFPIFRSCGFLLCLFVLLTDNGRRKL